MDPLTDQNLSEKVIVLGSYRIYQLNMQPKTSTPKLFQVFGVLKISRIGIIQRINIAVYDSVYNANPQV